MRMPSVPQPTADQLAALELEHGDVFTLSFYDDQLHVVVRRAKPMEFRRFKDGLRVDAQRAQAAPTLARACIVYPAPDVVQTVVDLLPALLDSIAGEVLELSGAAPAKKV